MTIPNISAKATKPIVIKFYIEVSRVEGMKICSYHPDPLTNMATIPIYGKNL